MAKKSKSKKAKKAPTRKKAAARPKRKSPEGLRLRTSTPSLTVNDLQRSLAFYRDALGFHVKDRWEQGGVLRGVELVAGSVSFFISQDDWKKGRDRVKGEGFRMHCETAQDVDQLAAGIKARGGSLIEEPKSQPWGTRDFAVADPDGFKITFSSGME
jgi:uncharacterized glyoxalase superfamily protein PhnB